MTKLNRQPAPKPRKTPNFAECARLAERIGFVGISHRAPSVGTNYHELCTLQLERGDYLSVCHPKRRVAFRRFYGAPLAARGSK